MKLLLSSLVCCLFMFSGCEYKDYYSHIEFEQNGDMYSAYPDEIDEDEKYIEKFKSNILREEYEFSSIKVDADVYNFMVVIPIKTKNDLKKDSSPDEYASMQSINGSDGALFTNKYTIDENGIFHYNLYAYSNSMKANGFFDDIHDISLDFNFYYHDNYDRYHYTSNTVTIKAQEIKDMLDNLGISYTVADSNETN